VTFVCDLLLVTGLAWFVVSFIRKCRQGIIPYQNIFLQERKMKKEKSFGFALIQAMVVGFAGLALSGCLSMKPVTFDPTVPPEKSAEVRVSSVYFMTMDGKAVPGDPLKILFKKIPGAVKTGDLIIPAGDHTFVVYGANGKMDPVTHGVSISGTFAAGKKYWLYVESVMEKKGAEEVLAPEDCASFDTGFYNNTSVSVKQIDGAAVSLIPTPPIIKETADFNSSPAGAYLVAPGEHSFVISFNAVPKSQKGSAMKVGTPVQMQAKANFAAGKKYELTITGKGEKDAMVGYYAEDITGTDIKEVQ
jgi:hypothetical protein